MQSYHTHTHTHTRARARAYVYIYIYIYIHRRDLQGRRQGASFSKMDRCDRLEEKRL